MKKVIAVLILLIVILLVVTYFYNKGSVVNEGVILSSNEGEFKLNDMKNYGSEQISTYKGDNYLGIALREIVKFHNINIEPYEQIIFHSTDGGSMAVNIIELNDLYLVDLKNKSESYLRLIIPTDEFSQRWLKYINRIELTDVKN